MWSRFLVVQKEPPLALLTMSGLGFRGCRSGSSRKTASHQRTSLRTLEEAPERELQVGRGGKARGGGGARRGGGGEGGARRDRLGDLGFGRRFLTKMLYLPFPIRRQVLLGQSEPSTEAGKNFTCHQHIQKLPQRRPAYPLSWHPPRRYSCICTDSLCHKSPWWWQTLNLNPKPQTQKPPKSQPETLG